MSFIEDLERQAHAERQAFLKHPFVLGIGDGSLEVERFKRFIRQDYVYLIDYCRVLALGAARAPQLDLMNWFSQLLSAILNEEMDLHRSYCAGFGISAEELEATQPAPTTLAYTSYMLRVAHQGSFGELMFALLPCQWGYWEVGDQLLKAGKPAKAPLYGRWIEMYSAPEYGELARKARDLANRLGEGAGPAERAAMRKAYINGYKLERQFWEMAWTLEDWPD